MIIALVKTDSAGKQTLRLVDLQGNDVLRMALPANTGVGGTLDGKVSLWDGHTLRALATDGTSTDIAQALPGASRLLLSPDGAERLWETSVVNSGQVHSTLSSDGRVLMDVTLTGRFLQTVAWTARGVVVEQQAQGLGGYYLFEVRGGPFDLLDLTTGSRRQLGDGTCSFEAMADDGTLACFAFTFAQAAARAITLRVTRPGSPPVDVVLPHDRFVQAGAVSFEPGTQAARLVLGGSPSLGSQGKPEQYETDVVDVATGAMHQLAAGMRPADGPWAWLPDGNMLCYTPAAAAGDPGLYEVSLDGPRRLITRSGGIPEAVLTL